MPPHAYLPPAPSQDWRLGLHVPTCAGHCSQLLCRDRRAPEASSSTCTERWNDCQPGKKHQFLSGACGRHVLEVHRAATQRNEGQEDEEREEAFFKRYLEFCRAKVSPRLSQPAADSLVSQYVELREQVRCSIPSCYPSSLAALILTSQRRLCCTCACAVQPCDEWSTPATLQCGVQAGETLLTCDTLPTFI